MSHPRVRPVFVLPLAVEPQVFFASLAEALAASGGRLRGNIFDSGAILRIRADERHFWSPALHLHTDGQSDTAVEELHGRFSPSSPVWTAFIAIYLALTCIAVAAACYGGAQLTLDRTPWAFLGVPVAIVLAGLTYGAAFIGQGLGAEDMHELRSFVEHVAESTSSGNAGRGTGEVAL